MEGIPSCLHERGFPSTFLILAKQEPAYAAMTVSAESATDVRSTDGSWPAYAESANREAAAFKRRRRDRRAKRGWDAAGGYPDESKYKEPREFSSNSG